MFKEKLALFKRLRGFKSSLICTLPLSLYGSSLNRQNPLTISIICNYSKQLAMGACTCILLPISLKPPNPNPTSNFSKHQHFRTSKITCSSITSESQLAKQELLNLISDQERGLKTQKDPAKLSAIIKAIDAMAVIGRDMVTTDNSLSATWRLLWTTEKEQLFIIEKANLFSTQAGDVLQVIDVEKGVLNNVITFPPDGVFFVRSDIEIASPQRVNFRFTSAVLRGKSWQIPLPPFGKGWFESVYLDDEIRVVKDIRGDFLVVDRAPYAWTE